MGMLTCAVFTSGAQHVDLSVHGDCVEAFFPLDDRGLWAGYELVCCSSSALIGIEEASSVSANGLGLISCRDLEELAVKPGTASASQEQSSKGVSQEVRVVPVLGIVNASDQS